MATLPPNVSFDTDSLKFDWVNKTAFIDKSIFGKKNKVYFIDQKDITLNLTWDEPKKENIQKVLPEQVGINLPGLKSIGLNGCAGQPGHFYQDAHFNGLWGHLAHAHCCPNDPDFGMFCTRPDYLFNPDGTYSTVVLHELAHLLVEPNTDFKVVSCGDSYRRHTLISTDKNSQDNATKIAHGKNWQEWARRLGIEPVSYGQPPEPGFNLEIKPLDK